MFGFARAKARYRLKRWVKIFYHPGYAAPQLIKAARVPNLQLDRAELVLETLAARGLLVPGCVKAPPVAASADLLTVHPSSYLEESSRPETLSHIFGLTPEWIDVDELLTAQRLAVGGTVDAARTAVGIGRGAVALNLGGGFHHAQPSKGSGFCVYNDVAVAIAVLRREGFTGRVAIIDLDFHPGDGNIVAFAQDAAVLTYGISGAVWTQIAAQACQELVLPAGTDDHAYLDTLERTLPKALLDHRVDLAFYVAGNDVLAGDSLGNFTLTPQGVLERDRRVVNAVRNLGAPLVITLAGGYSAGAWQCTANLLRWLLTDSLRARAQRAPDLRSHYVKVFSTILPHELQRAAPDDLTFTDQDLLSDLTETPRRRLILDFYTLQGIEFAFERYGVLRKIRRRGYAPLRFEGDPDDPVRQVIRIRGQRGDDLAWHLLVEIGARRRMVCVPTEVSRNGETEMLSVEWLLLQDPHGVFSVRRPQLPGQEFPGLGIAEDMHELFARVCVRLGLAGVVERPSHYHMAARLRDKRRFLDARVEGRFQAMRAVLQDLDLAEASHAVGEGRLCLAHGEPLLWEPDNHVHPVHERLALYFDSPGYRMAVENEKNLLLTAGLRVRPRR